MGQPVGKLLYELKTADGKERLLLFYCVGCGHTHPFRLAGKGDKWTYNDRPDSPTFSPSLFVNRDVPGAKKCHLFFREGKIQYLPDCDHELAGRTIDCPDFTWGDDGDD